MKIIDGLVVKETVSSEAYTKAKDDVAKLAAEEIKRRLDEQLAGMKDDAPDDDVEDDIEPTAEEVLDAVEIIKEHLEVLDDTDVVGIVHAFAEDLILRGYSSEDIAFYIKQNL